jgi:hypothetical protein
MRGCSPAGVESGSTPSLPTTKKKLAGRTRELGTAYWYGKWMTAWQVAAGGAVENQEEWWAEEEIGSRSNAWEMERQIRPQLGGWEGGEQMYDGTE